MLLCQEYRQTARNCQRYPPKWLSTLSMIWHFITDFLKLLSDRYQSRCHRRLPILNIPYFEWHWMHVQLRHICQPQTRSHQDSQALCILGAAPPGFQPGLAAWRNSLSSLSPTFPFTVCKLWPSARGMVSVALTAEYQECLKAGPFDVHYQCNSAWWHCDCSTRIRCVDTFCWHLSLIYLYKEDAWDVLVSWFFLNVIISLSLNDSAYNLLNDVLKIMSVWSCWKLALQYF